jgi:hypothetical protein
MGAMPRLMSRGRTGAWIALAVIAVSISAGALCATVACPTAVPLSSCHSTPSGPRLSDCCSSHSPSTVVSESRLATVAGPSLAPWAVPAGAAPAVTAVVLEASVGRAAVVPLFELHRSLLL